MPALLMSLFDQVYKEGLRTQNYGAAIREVEEMRNDNGVGPLSLHVALNTYIQAES